MLFRSIHQAIGGGHGVAAVALYGIAQAFCRSEEGDGVGIFTASLPVGSILHLINEGLAVSEGAGDKGRASCHTLRGYEGGVGVAALVIRGDYIRVVAVADVEGSLSAFVVYVAGSGFVWSDVPDDREAEGEEVPFPYPEEGGTVCPFSAAVAGVFPSLPALVFF